MPMRRHAEERRHAGRGDSAVLAARSSMQAVRGTGLRPKVCDCTHLVWSREEVGCTTRIQAPPHQRKDMSTFIEALALPRGQSS